jgi:hypothetical protein
MENAFVYIKISLKLMKINDEKRRRKNSYPKGVIKRPNQIFRQLIQKLPKAALHIIFTQLIIFTIKLPGSMVLLFSLSDYKQEMWATAAIGGVVLTFLRLYNLNEEKVRRALKKLSEKRIVDFADGETARITGKVVLVDTPLIAPLTKRRCCYYYAIVEREYKAESWETIAQEEDKKRIVLYDGTGYALIETEIVTGSVLGDANYSSGTFKDATPQLEAFLDKYEKVSTNLLGLNKTLRYQEGVLAENETVYVAGIGHWSTPQKYGLNIPSEKLLVISAGDKDVVYLTDDWGITP